MHDVHHMLLFGCSLPGTSDRVWDCGEMAVSEGGGNLRRAIPCFEESHEITNIIIQDRLVHVLEVREMHKETVLRFLNQNPVGCDLVFSFFASAVNSIRSDSCVRPFPPMYYNEDGIEKNIKSLRKLCNSMPTFSELPYLQNTEKHFEILNWLYAKCDPNSYIVCNQSEFPLNVSGYRPKYIFSIIYNEQSEQSWNNRKGTFKTSLAFHGSYLDRFYSILRVGLQQIFSTTTNPLFGEGIYLSKQLPVSIVYAPYGSGWVNSSIGENMSIVAVCEYIDDVTKRRYVRNSQGTIMKDIIVVTDSDSLRIKYLLVFAKKSNLIKGHIFTTRFIVGLVILIFAIFLYFNEFIRKFIIV